MSNKVLSEAGPKELEFTLQVRNNRLKERRLRLGMSQPRFAEAAQIALSVYRKLELLQASPQNPDGSWRDIALSLSAFHAVEPEDLFPPAVLAVAEPVIVRRIDGLDLREMMSTHQQRLLERPDELYDRVDASRQVARSMAMLTPREEEVLRLRFGLDGGGTRTLEEVAEVFGVQRARIYQIEAKGLRKLRHPSRSENLKIFVPDGKTKAEREEAKERARRKSLSPDERGHEDDERRKRFMRETHNRFIRDAESVRNRR